jgi:hypothetical protein
MEMRTKTTNSATDTNTNTGTSAAVAIVPFTIFSNWSTKSAPVAVDDNTSIGASVPGSGGGGAYGGASESARTHGYGFGYGTGREIDDGDYGSVAGNEHENAQDRTGGGVALSEEQMLGLFGTG